MAKFWKIEFSMKKGFVVLGKRDIDLSFHRHHSLPTRFCDALVIAEDEPNLLNKDKPCLYVSAIGRKLHRFEFLLCKQELTRKMEYYYHDLHKQKRPIGFHCVYDEEQEDACSENDIAFC